jgi:hypothetical protein
MEQSIAATSFSVSMRECSSLQVSLATRLLIPVHDGLQAEIKRNKGNWWMPWHREAMKDVVRCDKRRGAANRL